MKKLTAVVLALLMLFSGAVTVFAAAPLYDPLPMDEDNYDVTQDILADKTFVLGDANGDTSVDGKDALAVKANVAGLDGYTVDKNASDIDADGDCSAKDSYSLKLLLSGAKTPEDFENGYQIYNLTIGGNSIADYTIVIPEDTSYDQNLYFATEIFYEYVKKVSGHDLSIERGEKSGDHAVFFHDVDKDSELGETLGVEGYRYEVKDGDLHIYGTTRGNMYAVYEILEDYFGFGFVNIYWTFSYKKRAVDLEEGLSRTFVPGYRFRWAKTTFNYNEGFRDRLALPRAMNGLQGYNPDVEKVPITYLGNFVGPVYRTIHSFHYYHQMASGTMPDESFGTLLDRYYAKQKSAELPDETTWEPCATSEAEYKLLFTGLLETMEMIIDGSHYPFDPEDGQHFFSFSPCDNTLWCTCRNCRKAADQTSYTDIYLELKNRGARDIQAYYPGVKLYSLMYEKEAPVATIPDGNLILVLGGTSCQNHALGAEEECAGNGLYNMSNKDYEEFVNTMYALCQQTGAELWVWYYPETNNWWIYDIPNVYNIYYDFVWLFEHGITGAVFEGHNYTPGYTFENMKAYLVSQVLYDPSLTLEEYDQHIRNYMYMIYGEGWEHIYEFMKMYEEAGDLAGKELGSTESYCFVGAYNRAFDFVSFEYIAENYEYMRSLIVAALDEFDAEKNPKGAGRTEKLYQLLCTFDLLGLGATYVDSYKNGTDEQRATYEERYRWLYDYYIESGMRYYCWNYSGMAAPETFNLDSNPFIQFTAASVRPEITKALQG